MTLTRNEVLELTAWTSQMADKSRACGKTETSDKLEAIRRILEDVAIYFGTTEKRTFAIKEAETDPTVKGIIARMKRYEGSVDMDRTDICPYSKDGRYCGPCTVNNGCFTIEGSSQIFMCLTKAACRMHFPRKC